MRSTAVRPHNRRLLLQLLRTHGPQSRAQLGALSGLSPAAITSVVSELIDDQLVAEHAEATRLEGRVGRPATLVSLAAASRTVLSMQIGAGIVQVGACDLEANLLDSDSARFDARTPAETVLATAVEMLTTIIDGLALDRGQIIGLGVGAAGLVDQAGRVNLMSSNAGWTDVPIADHCERHLGIPTSVDHNVRAMAVGEARYGLAVNLESHAYLYVRSGVGLALVLDGKPYRGGVQGAPEIGHLRVSAGTERCQCGKVGCLETVVTDRVVRDALGAAAVSIRPVDAAAPDRSWIDEWVASASAGDAESLDLVNGVANAVGEALAIVVEVIDPQLVVVGGLLADASTILLDPLREATARNLTPWRRAHVRIEPTAYGADSGLIGAATVALDHFLFGPSLLPRALAGA